jgi:hypothetical protein
MKLSYLPLSLLLFTPLAAAQSVMLRGKVEDVSGTTGQFIVDCTNVDLSSAAFNLNLFVGSQTEIHGTWNGSSTNPAVVVTAIQLVPETFEIGGGGKIGETAKPTVTGAPGSLATTFASTSTSFAPLGAWGSVFLGGNPFHTGTGTIPGGGTLELAIQIPNDPTLVGVDVFGQGAIIDTVGGTVLLTNPDCKTLES